MLHSRDVDASQRFKDTFLVTVTYMVRFQLGVFIECDPPPPPVLSIVHSQTEAHKRSHTAAAKRHKHW